MILMLSKTTGQMLFRINENIYTNEELSKFTVNKPSEFITLLSFYVYILIQYMNS
jgi:hypothetical protein